MRWPHVLALLTYSAVGMLIAWVLYETRFDWEASYRATILLYALCVAFYGSLVYAPLYLIGFVVTHRPKATQPPQQPPTNPHGHATLTGGYTPPHTPYQPNVHGSSTQPLTDEELERRRIKARRRAIIMASYMYHHRG